MKNEIINVLFVFGTRPEAIKLAPVIKEFERNRSFNPCVCVTAQHREMLDQMLELFSIDPQYDFNIMTERQPLHNLTANVLLKVTEVIEKENPSLVFVHGDTTTTVAAALAAYYLKIPIAHIEAGLRTGKKYSPFPEEINRRLTSAMSDFHFAPTEGAKMNLIAEGFKESSVFVTGNTVIDALDFVLARHNKKEVKEKWNQFFLSEYNICISDNVKTILVTGHRRENFGEGFKRICNALHILAINNQDIQIVYPVHLNPNVQEPVYNILGNVDNIYLIPPLDYEPFVFLMSQSELILTDSGGIQEEAPTLGIPVLVMRDTSERPEGLKAGLAILVGTDIETIVAETQKLLNNRDKHSRSNLRNPYGDGKASKRIIRIISEHFMRNE